MFVGLQIDVCLPPVGEFALVGKVGNKIFANSTLANPPSEICTKLTCKISSVLIGVDGNEFGVRVRCHGKVLVVLGDCITCDADLRQNREALDAQPLFVNHLGCNFKEQP